MALMPIFSGRDAMTVVHVLFECFKYPNGRFSGFIPERCAEKARTRQLFRGPKVWREPLSDGSCAEMTLLC